MEVGYFLGMEWIKTDYCECCGEPIWITRYGNGWQMTYRPGATVQVDVVDDVKEVIDGPPSKGVGQYSQ